jgi:cbb3-type cytochrome oxidase subunit 1
MGYQMKLLNAMKTLTVSFLMMVLMLSTAYPNNRYTNYEGQGVWNSVSSEPVVRVTIQGSTVKVNAIASGLPAISLKKVNSHLLNEYTEHYIKIQDYNNDGFVDIGVLKSAGLGGSKLCYAVYAYKPDFYSFSARASKTICID